jgi:hypothetical protein
MRFKRIEGLSNSFNNPTYPILLEGVISNTQMMDICNLIVVFEHLHQFDKTNVKEIHTSAFNVTPATSHYLLDSEDDVAWTDNLKELVMLGIKPSPEFLNFIGFDHDFQFSDDCLQSLAVDFVDICTEDKVSIINEQLIENTYSQLENKSINFRFFVNVVFDILDASKAYSFNRTNQNFKLN